MKSSLILLHTLLLVSLSSLAQLNNGLVAHWTMNGNANDVTGKGHNGTLFNVTPATGSTGQANTAMSFNGLNSFISIPYQPDMNTTDLTVCAIVKPTGFYSGVCQGNFIFSRGTHQTQGSYSLSYFDNCYNSCNDLDTNLHVFCLQVGGVTYPGTAWQSPHKVHTGKWYCVVATFSGNTMKMYVDGVLQLTVPASSVNIGSSTDEITIGRFLGGGPGYPYWYNGLIDDLRLYNRALTDAEVLLYCSTPPPIDPGGGNPGGGNPGDTTVTLIEAHDVNLCGDNTFTIPYLTTPNFNAGNIFTAELSDQSGGFSNPVTIGSVSSIVSGYITCTIPPNTQVGTYKVRVRGSNPARTSGLLNLAFYPAVIAGYSFAPATPDTNKPTRFTNTSVNAKTYQWSFGDGTTSTEVNPVHMFPKTGNYRVCLVADNEAGCRDTMCEDVTAIIHSMIGVPTGFSPNGDGTNDILYVRGTGVKEMRLRIYNRWGQVIFETTSFDSGWDGNYQGQKQDLDVVGYTLEATFSDGTNYHKQGNITIIR